jgi:hypothetical protein
MTLTEYLNQESPVRGPRVLLEKEELNILTTIRVAGEERSLVTIQSEDPLLRSAEYLLIRGRLWAMDRDGNPRARSVFHVK